MLGPELYFTLYFPNQPDVAEMMSFLLLPRSQGKMLSIQIADEKRDPNDNPRSI